MDEELKQHIEDVKFDGLLLKDLPLVYRANKQVVIAAIVRNFNEYYWDDKMFTSKMFEVLAPGVPSVQTKSERAARFYLHIF